MQQPQQQQQQFIQNGETAQASPQAVSLHQMMVLQPNTQVQQFNASQQQFQIQPISGWEHGTVVQADQMQFQVRPFQQPVPNQGYRLMQIENPATIQPYNNTAENPTTVQGQPSFSAFQIVPTSNNQILMTENNSNQPIFHQAQPVTTVSTSDDQPDVQKVASPAQVPWVLSKSPQFHINKKLWNKATAYRQPVNVSQPLLLHNGSFLQNNRSSQQYGSGQVLQGQGFIQNPSPHNSTVPGIPQNNDYIQNTSQIDKLVNMTKRYPVNIQPKTDVTQAASINHRPPQMLQTTPAKVYKPNRIYSSAGITVTVARNLEAGERMSTVIVLQEKKNYKPQINMISNLVPLHLFNEEGKLTFQQLLEIFLPPIITARFVENGIDVNNQRQIEQAINLIRKTITNIISVTQIDQLQHDEQILTLPASAGKRFSSHSSPLLLEALQRTENTENGAEVSDENEFSSKKQETANVKCPKCKYCGVELVGTSIERGMRCTVCGKRFRLSYYDKKRKEAENETKSKDSNNTDEDGHENIDAGVRSTATASETMDVEKRRLSGVSSTNNGVLKSNPSKWTVSDVCDFIREIPDALDYVEEFSNHNIDGEALMLMKEDHLTSIISMKLGLAVKIVNKINTLREPPPS